MIDKCVALGEIHALRGEIRPMVDLKKDDKSENRFVIFFALAA